MKETSLIRNWCVRVFNSNVVGHSQNFRQPSSVDAGIGAGFAQRG
jgi:hypothetical protein